MKKTAIWFPAKRYGWGWGLPICWQGWVVLSAYLGLLVLGAAQISLAGDAPWFVLYALVLSAGFVTVCWWKGEPPRWRWGGPGRKR